MLTENTTTDDLLSSGEDTEDESLDWLLDEDYEEPKDTLFALSEESFDTSLSETELEMAARRRSASANNSPWFAYCQSNSRVAIFDW